MVVPEIKTRVTAVVGTRPTFIEMAPVIHELQKASCNLSICHTGQHYDKEMSTIFLERLNIPFVKYSLESGSGSHAKQTAKIVTRFEDVLGLENPDLVIVEGDTTSAFAASLAAVKLKVPVAYVEAGCRTYDHNLPEEVNRVLISHISSVQFPATPNCRRNLLREGIAKESIGPTGHPIVDSIDLVKSKIRPIAMVGDTLVERDEYYYFTLHRDFNVDDPERLRIILAQVSKVAADGRRKIVFAMHPRTRKRIREFRLGKYLNDIIVSKPVDYLTSLSLASSAYAILSDSGGLTKESTILGVPCITLRPDTEWTETLGGFSNQLAFARGNSIPRCIKLLEKNYDSALKNLKNIRGLFGKPGVSKKIVRHLMELQFKSKP